MKLIICLAALLVASIGIARAEPQEIRGCEFKAKMPRVWGEASVTLTDGKLAKLSMSILYSSGERGRPGYTCTIDASRTGDLESKWSEDGGATVITNATPFNENEPDRIK